MPRPMSRISTRTKMAVGIGVIVVAVVVVLLRPTANPPVTVSFVRYAARGDLATLRISNCTSTTFALIGGYRDKLTPLPGDPQDFKLLSHSSRLFEYDFGPSNQPPRRIYVSGYCPPGFSFRRWLNTLLFRI